MQVRVDAAGSAPSVWVQLNDGGLATAQAFDDDDFVRTLVGREPSTPLGSRSTTVRGPG